MERHRWKAPEVRFLYNRLRQLPDRSPDHLSEASCGACASRRLRKHGVGQKRDQPKLTHLGGIAIPRLAAFTNGVHPLLAAYAASFTDIAPPELSSSLLHAVSTTGIASRAAKGNKYFFME